jgi:hypothetical protein
LELPEKKELKYFYIEESIERIGFRQRGEWAFYRWIGIGHGLGGSIFGERKLPQAKHLTALLLGFNSIGPTQTIFSLGPMMCAISGERKQKEGSGGEVRCGIGPTGLNKMQ